MANLTSLEITGNASLRLPVGTTAQRPGTDTSRIRYNTDSDTIEFVDQSDIWTTTELPEQFQFRKPSGSFQRGLAGKFYNGTWRFNGDRAESVTDGNVGGFETLPLTTTNQSSNIVSNTTQVPQPYGVGRWTSINWTSSMGDEYGAIWVGYFIPPTTGTYGFATASDDSSGCWIGTLAKGQPGARNRSNATLNNNLGFGQGRTRRSTTVSLIAKRWYPIRIVWEEIGGGDNMTFYWSGPGIPETIDLSQHFRCRVKFEPAGYFDGSENAAVYGDF